MHSVILGNYAGFQLLIKKREIDIEAVDSNGMTVFHYAAQNPDPLFLQELLIGWSDSKAVVKKDKNTKCPFDLSVGLSRPSFKTE